MNLETIRTIGDDTRLGQRLVVDKHFAVKDDTCVEPKASVKSSKKKIFLLKKRHIRCSATGMLNWVSMRALSAATVAAGSTSLITTGAPVMVRTDTFTMLLEGPGVLLTGR